MAEGIELHVNVWAGAGVPFLLVHGLASNARMWDGVAERLTALGHPVAAFDQRGHGRSSKPDGGYDFASVTGDLVALMAQLGMDRPVVAGQSWGGNVALELAHRRDDLVRGIACVDGGTIDLSERFPTWDDCAAALAPPRTEGTPYDEMERRFRLAHPDWPDSGIYGTLACFERRADGTVVPWLTLERHMKILRAMWEQHPGELYADLRVPVLLVPAETGMAVKRAAVERAKKSIPRVRTRWFAADHDIHAHRPAELADLLHSCVDDGFFA